jgi:AraC-like DNA-binding protein
MKNLIDKIRISIGKFVLQTLDITWRTENFHLSQPGIPFTRLYYPMEGCGHVLLNGEQHIISPGEIYLISPYAPAIVSCPKRLVKYWGHFNAFILDSKLDIFTFASPLIKIKDDDPDFRIKLFNILCENHLKRSNAPQSSISELEDKSALTLLLAPFLREIRDTLVSDRELTRFASLLEYIETHLEKGLNLQELGAFSGMNPTYLSNLFAQKTGVPLMKYCKQRSVQRATDLMWTGKYSFSEIAYKSGAENVAVFSRLFKKQTGLSPRAMQKQINESKA